MSVANKGPFLLFTHCTLSGFFSWKKGSLKKDPASAKCKYRTLSRSLTVCIYRTCKHHKQPAHYRVLHLVLVQSMLRMCLSVLRCNHTFSCTKLSTFPFLCWTALLAKITPRKTPENNLSYPQEPLPTQTLTGQENLMARSSIILLIN